MDSVLEPQLTVLTKRDLKYTWKFEFAPCT